MNGQDVARLAAVLQDLDDSLDIMGAMFDLDDLGDHEHEVAHDIARVALRESVTERFQRAIATLKALAVAIDPATVGETPLITPPNEAWLCRQLAEVSDG